ncbi:39fa2fb5-e631-4703-a932-a56f688e3646 [Sclerotinia trifoliorum]|uniref:39fa2fb5-e631-4703-a932-a56f688e3646 n=1 Tax=Sclerotinia trifoliorum TaxID=28548 RepID=A0A8H2ZQ20_9HELO|nr:39fa2fb5-e631-4703-a932-a56f688e3646 [Sclerotinia trifoliorum]
MNTNARRRGAKVAPSHYPRVAFHGLRFAQLISAAIVGGIMAYFMYYLRAERFPIPWTFIVLLSISLAMVAVLTLTIIIYNFTYLSPKFNCLLNGTASIFWMLGLGLLSWSLSNTLKKSCDVQTWRSSTAVGVCREYKSLWTFTLIGTMSTLAALGLDIWTHMKTIKRGIYVMPEDDKNAAMLKQMNVGNNKAKGYEPSRGGAFEEELDIAYHNRYGDDAMESVGYHDRVLDK